jgi:aminoglycoside phosphotransferase (APT) family kinase protein
MPLNLVVRVSFGDDPAERAHAEYEARVLEKVGGFAAPSLLDFSPTSRWFATPAMSMTFVPGRQSAVSEASRAELERLGSVVAWVHSQPIDDLVERLPETGDMASYAAGRMSWILGGLPWVREPLAATTQARLTDAAAVLERSWDVWRSAESFGSGEPLALLHGDIALGNILWSPDPVLIDWEYARLGDPADEVAYLFDQNGLTAPQRAAFWRGYGAGTSDDVRLAHLMDRARWWEPITLLGSALWWVERLVRRTEADSTGSADPAVPREPSYYFDQVARRLNRLDELVEQR